MTPVRRAAIAADNAEYTAGRDAMRAELAAALAEQHLRDTKAYIARSFAQITRRALERAERSQRHYEVRP